jgi:hypothetical protein
VLFGAESQKNIAMQHLKFNPKGRSKWHFFVPTASRQVCGAAFFCGEAR